MSARPAMGALGLRDRRTFIYLALSWMTASWITGLLRAFLGDAGAPPLLTLVVLSLLTFIPLRLGRWLRGFDLRGEVRRGLLVAAFFFLALLVLSSGFYNHYGLVGSGWMGRLLRDELSSGTFLNQTTSLTLVALCWWMGLTLGDLRLTSTNLNRYFYLSIFFLISPAIFFLADVSQDVTWLFFAFLFASLMALGLGRVEEVGRRSQERGSPFTLYWLAQTGLVAAVILLLVALAQALRLAHGLGLILVIVAPVLSLLAFPLVFVGARIIAFALGRAVESGTFQPPTEPDLATAGSQAAQTYDPSNAQSLCVGLFVLSFFFAITLAALYSARRWRQLATEMEREEGGALSSLGEQVSQALAQRLGRARVNLPGVGRLRRRLAARSIRRIYASLIALAAERGYPRPAARTPSEHLPAMRQAFPGSAPQIARITAAYVAAHYGQVPDSREALQEIKAAWGHVRATARSSVPVPGAATADTQENGHG